MEWDSGTTKRLSKNLSYPSALERLHTCFPPASVLRLWEVGWTLKNSSLGLRIPWDSQIQQGHFVSTDDRWKVSLCICQLWRHRGLTAAAVQTLQDKDGLSKYPWNSSHVEQGCTDVLWKWKVWKGEQRVVPGNDSVGGKSKVSVLGMSQLSCLTSGGRSISVYCLQSCCYKFSIHMRHFIQEMFGQKYCKAICGKVMNWGVNNFRFFFIWKSNIHSTLDFPILC